MPPTPPSTPPPARGPRLLAALPPLGVLGLALTVGVGTVAQTLDLSVGEASLGERVFVAATRLGRITIAAGLVLPIVTGVGTAAAHRSPTAGLRAAGIVLCLDAALIAIVGSWLYHGGLLS